MEPLRASKRTTKKDEKRSSSSAAKSEDSIARKPATTVEHIAFGVKVALMANAFGVASGFGMAGAVYHARGDRRKGNAIARDALRVVGGAVLNVRVQMLGRENLGGQRPAVFVCNHQNILDIFLLSYIFPDNCAIMAKDSFFYIPLMGQFLYLADNIFIDRENAKSAAKTMKFVSDELKRKNMGMFMFPEGTRSYQTDNSLLPFKQGAFRLAVEGQMPIIPIVVSTYGDVCDETRKVFKGGDVVVKVLDPIPTVGKTQADVRLVMDQTRNLMLNTLKEISKPNARSKL
ncbi:1-acylglycerol-3-phosphate O-acyltransferase [Chytriomyces hyalinus]|nr:1-acylglycerol-3-phosphate O-acyltransferase [Chytriomyces hyalinus]